jgi:hypothetical protein
MRPISRITAAVLALAGLAAVPAAAPPADDPPKQKPLTLLGILADWQYPGSAMPDGATMSDGGVPGIQSIRCHAILTTPDPFAKVVAFYEARLGTPPAAEPQKEPAEKPDRGAQSVIDQDDSRGRPFALRIFSVNAADSSTTLVVSRAEGEKETHIAWSHFRRLDDRR